MPSLDKVTVTKLLSAIRPLLFQNRGLLDHMMIVLRKALSIRELSDRITAVRALLFIAETAPPNIGSLGLEIIGVPHNILLFLMIRVPETGPL